MFGYKEEQCKCLFCDSDINYRIGQVPAWQTAEVMQQVKPVGVGKTEDGKIKCEGILECSKCGNRMKIEFIY